MSAENKEKFCTIFDWMFRDLGLTGNSAILYATIYHFSLGENKFNGSLTYLSDFIGITKQAVIRILQELESKGLVEKTEIYKNSVKFCEYKALAHKGNIQNFKGGQKMLPPIKKVEGGSQKSLTGVVKKFDPIIKNDNKEDSIEASFSLRSKDAKPQAARNPQPKKPSSYSTDWLVNEGVPYEVAEAHATIRKAKKVPYTKLAIDGLKREARNAGISLTEAVCFSAERGYVGFKADWYAPQRKPNVTDVISKAMSLSGGINATA